VIEQLEGKVLAVKPEAVTLSVSGVGFRVAITPRHSLKIRHGETLSVFTRMVVREDDISLFGFESESDQEVFDLLCSVNGIGPKLAMTALAGMDAQDIRNAVNNQDDAAFRSISGIGPKTAKLIVISLANKVGLSASSPHSRVLEALLQLGTDDALARKAIADLDPTLDDSQALKAALASLAKAKVQ
jgi:Holliday junction DNA helicase RuvA